MGNNLNIDSLTGKTVQSKPPPYHVFIVLNDYFVFDTTGCRFYKIEEPIYRFLKLCLSISISEARETMLSEDKFSKQTIEDVAKTVTLFSKNGLWDIPNFFMSDKDFMEKIETAVHNPLFRLELMLADTCNLACKYCFSEQSHDMPIRGLMTKKMAQQSIDMHFTQSEQLENIEILFIGGEPLLNKSVFRFAIEYCQQKVKLNGKKVRYTMTTNGTLLDDEIVDFIKKYNVSLNVSFDGPRDIHDDQCPMKSGAGSSYDAVVEGIKKLLDKNCYFEIRSTMTSPTPQLKELIKFFDNYDISRFNIVPADDPFDAFNEICFTESDIADLIYQEEEILPWIVDKILATDKPKYYPCKDYIRIIESEVTSPVAPICRCQVCTIATNVAVNGDLFPCARLSGKRKWQIGHVSTGLDYGRCKSFWRDYRKNIAPTCKDCWALPICKGPSPCSIMQTNGSFLMHSKYCELNKMRIKHAVYIYAKQQN